MNYYTKYKDAITDLQKMGHNLVFEFNAENYSIEFKGDLFSSVEVVINNIFRLKSISKDGKNLVIFAITTSDGRKGYLKAHYGTYEELKLIEFMDKVKIAAND